MSTRKSSRKPSSTMRLPQSSDGTFNISRDIKTNDTLHFNEDNINYLNQTSSELNSNMNTECNDDNIDDSSFLDKGKPAFNDYFVKSSSNKQLFSYRNHYWNKMEPTLFLEIISKKRLCTQIPLNTKLLNDYRAIGLWKCDHPISAQNIEIGKAFHRKLVLVNTYGLFLTILHYDDSEDIFFLPLKNSTITCLIRDVKAGNLLFHMNLVRLVDDGLLYPMISVLVSNDQLMSDSLCVYVETMSTIITHTNIECIGDRSSDISWVAYGKPEDSKSIDMLDTNRMLEEMSLRTNTHLEDITEDSIDELRQCLSTLGITTRLRKYQYQGVLWIVNMLVNSSRRHVMSFNGWLPLIFPTSLSKSSDMFQSWPPPHSTHLQPDYYFNIESGLIKLALSKKIDIDTNSSSESNYPVKVHGGAILADSMGIGKSLQVLSLIIYLKHIYIPAIGKSTQIKYSNTKKFSSSGCVCGKMTSKLRRDGYINCSICGQLYHRACSIGTSAQQLEYVCLSCECRTYFNNPIYTSTSLVIVPDNLIHQWKYEIQKHTNSSNCPSIYIYEGCDIATMLRKGSLNDSCPTRLSRYDIILVGLTILKKELHVSDCLKNESIIDSKLRNRERNTISNYYPPPLLALHFNLVAIDETQRIESTTINSYLELINKIKGNYRLCISGTPIGHGKLSDLKSLCSFLRIQPYCDFSSKTWENLFVNSIYPIESDRKWKWLYELFGNITLRRSKEMVMDQLGLPDKMFIVKILHFTKFERALYNERQAQVATELNVSSLSESNAIDAKFQLESLRKGCCHPQLFDKSYTAYRNHTKGSSNESKRPRPFGEIIILKVEQTRLQCEERLREYVYHLFTMAGSSVLLAQVCMSRQSTQLFVQHMIRAILIYLNAEEYYRRSQCSCPLITIVRISDHQGISENRDFEYIGETTMPSMSLSFTFRCKLKQIKPRSQLTQANISWVNNIELSRLSNQRDMDTSSEYLDTSFDITYHLHSSHQISSLDAVSIDTTKMNQLLNENIHSGEYAAILFPRRIHLTSSNIYSISKSYDVSLPIMLSSSNIMTLSVAKTEGEEVSLNRSKTWRLSISSVYEDCYILVKKDATGSLKYGLPVPGVNVYELSMVLGEPVQGYLNICPLFSESMYGMDVYQQIHLFHNLRDVSNDLIRVCSNHTVATHLMNIYTDKPSHQLKSLSETSKNISSQFFNTTDEISANESGASIDSIPFYKDIQTRIERIKSQLLNAAEARYQTALVKIHKDLDSSSTKQSFIVSMMNQHNHRRDWWMKYFKWLSSINDYSAGSAGLLLAIQQSIDQGIKAYEKFRNARELTGVSYYLTSELEHIESCRLSAIKAITIFDQTITSQEIIHSGDCKKCRAYLGKTGPVCHHCQIGDVIDIYSKSLLAYRSENKTILLNHANAKSKGYSGVGQDEEVDDENGLEVVKRGEFEVESFYIMVCKLVRMYIRRYKHTEYYDISDSEIEYISSLKSEVVSMRDSWNRRLELLKVYDEIEMCKQRIQLIPDSEGMHEVQYDIDGRLHAFQLDDSYSTAYHQSILSETMLKDSLSNLAFYKNQEDEARHVLGNQQRTMPTDNPNQTIETSNDQTHTLEVKETETSSECVICRENMFNIEYGSICMLPCCHVIHVDCIKEWFKTHKTCPTCKRRTKPSELVPVDNKPTNETSASSLTTLSMTSELHNKYSVSVIDSRKHFVKVIDTKSMTQRTMNGQWGTKINAVISDVLDFLDNPDTFSDKAIIFSQWIEMIEIVSEALKENKVKHICCLTNKDFKVNGPLEKFKSDPMIPILLLPIHLGAEGLDLIIASHVFLFEPLLSKELEEQAINRIDRIGQIKPTKIYRYIISDTVEERIYSSIELPSLLDNSVEEGNVIHDEEALIGVKRKHDDDRGDNITDFAYRDNVQRTPVKSRHDGLIELNAQDTPMSANKVNRTPKRDQDNLTLNDVIKILG